MYVTSDAMMRACLEDRVAPPLAKGFCISFFCLSRLPTIDQYKEFNVPSDVFYYEVIGLIDIKKLESKLKSTGNSPPVS